jgi:hypothetical protein
MHRWNEDLSVDGGRDGEQVDSAGLRARLFRLRSGQFSLRLKSGCAQDDAPLGIRRPVEAELLQEGVGKLDSQMEYSIRRLKPLLILLGFCGATGSRALSKPKGIEFFRSC